MSPERIGFDAMGCRCEIVAMGRSTVELAGAAAWVGALGRRLTRFSPDSELSRLNAAAGHGWQPVSSPLEAVLRAALDAFRDSGGLVHAGLLAHLQAAGYTRTFAAGPALAVEPPSPPSPLPHLLEVRPGSARLAAGAALDLGGIAKGWMADRLAEQLGDAVVNLGGDLRALGGGPTGTGWPVAVGDSVAMLRGQGAATSGRSKRQWGDGLHHLIDPRTGRPAAAIASELSVVAPTALEAEVLAKTALLLGEQGLAHLRSAGALGWRVAA